MTGTMLGMASAQWAKRPNDQRFLTLADLKASVDQRRRESWTVTPPPGDLRIIAQDDGRDAAGEGGLAVRVFDPTKGQVVDLTPSHWAFGQLAQYAQAPAGYLRTLPAQLAAINLQWGLERNPLREAALVLAQSNGDESMRAMTGITYGRIWDTQVVEAVERVNEDGRWQIPAASYSGTNPLRATTLYASDRDVFIFLVDPDHPIQIGNETLFRGFMTYNSEVGSAVFGLTTFLYRTVCDNRLIWGATDVRELRIRHTGGAPERFAYEGQRYLSRYADESTDQIAAQIKKAQDKIIDVKVSEGNTVQDWLQSRGFSKAQAKASVDSAVAEEGDSRTLWQIINGVTAYARSIQHTDQRVELETKAGKLMELAN